MTMVTAHIGIVVVALGFWLTPGRSAPPEAAPAYQRLVSILQPGGGAAPPANIEQLLQALPDDLRTNFTLVYASRSPHRDEISPQFPRTVLFTTDAKLLLTFTGDPAAPAYNGLEVIYFDDRTSAFHTTRFILADAVRRDPRLKSAAALNGAMDQYECTRCHGGDVRPIFDSYSLWPGFYGSRADTIDAYPRENQDYERFLEGNAKKGGYRYLRFPAGSPTPPYQVSTMRLKPGEALGFHPNERLGDALTELNWKRIGRKLASQGDRYRQLRYPLLSGMLGCSALPIFTALFNEVERDLRKENARRLERAGIPGGEIEARKYNMQELVPGITPGIAEVAYLAKALGVSRADWSLSMEPSALGFFDGILTRPVLYVKQDLLTAMLGELASNDPDFEPFYDASYVLAGYGYRIGFKLNLANDYGNPELCQLLADRARTARAPNLETVERMNERERAGLPPAGKTTEAVLARCAVCHEGFSPDFAGVAIPFTDPAALRDKLRSERSLRSGKPLLEEMLTRISPHAKDPMPPSSSVVHFRAAERGELGAYLSRLAGTRQEGDPREPLRN